MEIICGKCAEINHQNHKAEPIDKQAKIYRDIFSKKFKIINKETTSNTRFLDNLERELKQKTNSAVNNLHKQQQQNIRRTNETMTKLKDSVTNQTKLCQDDINVIRAGLQQQDKIKTIKEHINKASDWVLLQTLYEREEEINNIIKTMNGPIRSKKALSAPLFETGKNVTKLEDQVLKEICKCKTSEKMQTQLSPIGSLNVLPKKPLTFKGQSNSIYCRVSSI